MVVFILCISQVSIRPKIKNPKNFWKGKNLNFAKKEVMKIEYFHSDSNNPRKFSVYYSRIIWAEVAHRTLPAKPDRTVRFTCCYTLAMSFTRKDNSAEAKLISSHHLSFCNLLPSLRMQVASVYRTRSLPGCSLSCLFVCKHQHHPLSLQVWVGVFLSIIKENEN